MKTFYILKAVDCHGDQWPLPATIGIAGAEFDTPEEASRFWGKSTPSQRREWRESAGWQKGSIIAISCYKVIIE